MVMKTFNMDDQTAKKLQEEALKLHISRSSFLRFLVWRWSHEQEKTTNNIREVV